MAEVIRVESRESSGGVKSYRDLVVWQKSRFLVKNVYVIVSAFPKEEMYGLSSQIKRAAVSIPSNIAEGSARRSTQEFIRYINIATGSLAELETQLLLAQDLGFAKAQQLTGVMELMDEISRMLQGLHDALQAKLH